MQLMTRAARGAQECIRQYLSSALQVLVKQTWETVAMYQAGNKGSVREICSALGPKAFRYSILLVFKSSAQLSNSPLLPSPRFELGDSSMVAIFHRRVSGVSVKQVGTHAGACSEKKGLVNHNEDVWGKGPM
jgi:hypothetical protein